MKHKKEPTGILYTIGRGKNIWKVWVPQSGLMYLSLYHPDDHSDDRREADYGS